MLTSCIIFVLDSIIRSETEDETSNSSFPFINNAPYQEMVDVQSIIEEDEELPESIRVTMLNVISTLDNRWRKMKSNKVVSCKVLTTEKKLLDLVYHLRVSLRVVNPNFEKALQTLDELIKLPITALMLKKNQAIVDTFRKIVSYSANLKNSQMMTKKEITETLTKSRQVRWKAMELMDKCRELFVPPHSRYTFQETFNKDVEYFYKTIKDMDIVDVYGMTSDP